MNTFKLTRLILILGAMAVIVPSVVSAETQESTSGNSTSAIVEILSKTTGPGGCTTLDSCRTFCDSKENFAECQSFARNHGLNSAPKARVSASPIGKATPGNCSGPDSCRSYCSKPERRTECIKFAVASGYISGNDGQRLLGNAQSATGEQGSSIEAIIKTSGGPGGCTSLEACKAYCSKIENQEACLAFAKNNNLISGQNYEKQQKALREYRSQWMSPSPSPSSVPVQF